jgi:hypothetical protein
MPRFLEAQGDDKVALRTAVLGLVAPMLPNIRLLGAWLRSGVINFRRAMSGVKMAIRFSLWPFP